MQHFKFSFLSIIGRKETYQNCLMGVQNVQSNARETVKVNIGCKLA